ncbi:MAG: decaprenylphospho-beta-D-erythro-pentofuranosid-2-ulose 2-reductase [Acidothermales bacterium]|nr:decaprenylphospho-beta-D-erythro-pentofuranosid-2-ulose 2-reductase [Acidothermales bacterium]
MKDALGSVDSVLVLGGRSTIGLAIAQRLVARGCRRVVLAVRPGGGAAGDDGDPVAALRQAGAQQVDVVAFDATDMASHGGVVDEVFDRLGDVDVVVAAFGVLGDQADFDADPQAAAHAATVNFVAHVSAGLHVARRLRAQGHGTLVVLSSVAGLRVRRSNFVYGSTKAGLDGFGLGLGDALHGSGARVMVVRPGFVRTPMTAHLPDAPFAVDAEDVAEAVVDGLARNADIVHVPVRLRPLFTVLRLLPRPVWRRLPF